jgi:hypothetical protein
VREVVVVHAVQQREDDNQPNPTDRSTDRARIFLPRRLRTSLL